MLVGGEGTGQPGPGDERAATDRVAGLRRPTAWAALAAIAMLVTGVALVMRSARRPAPPPPAPATGAVAPGDSGSDRAIGEALKQAESDKDRWVEEVPGVDLSGLDSARRAFFLASANAQRCTCGCGYTLAGCRAYDPTCEKSGPRVAALLDSVRRGRIPKPGAGG